MRLHHACLLLAFFPLAATPAYAYGNFEVPSTYSAPSWAVQARYRPFTGYEPRHRRHVRAHYRRSYAHYGRSYSRALPSPCYLAARQGGPCGCVAMGHIFGRYDHVLNGMNLWLARTWLGFPRTSPRPGTAAVWGTHHVEAIISNNGDGTITTSGPYGNRRVRIASVAIVDPHGGYASHHEGRHRHYARAW